MFTRLVIFAALCLSLCNLASATVLSGAGGDGVPVGKSSLIHNLQYSDTFTGTADGGQANRPYAAAVQPSSAYVIEKSYGNPSVNFQTSGQSAGVGEFSFAADAGAQPGLVNGSPSYPGTSGAGSATGFTQTGNGVDYGIAYGLSSHYVVQVDAVNPGDRVDITSGPTAGTIGGGNLSVFIRGSGTGGVDLYNGVTDTAVPGINTGLGSASTWHNYAVDFNQTTETLKVYVDEQLKGTINLNTFAGGLYAGFSNANVGVGEGLGGGQNRVWTDNFQVGNPTPEPSTFILSGLGAVALLLAARRRRKG